MRPRVFLDRLKKEGPRPGYLFLGDEAFYRDGCRRALLRAVLGKDATASSEDGLIEVDLKEQALSRLVDEARTYSLFAPSRVIIGASAEEAIPKRVDGRAGSSPEAAALAAYFESPTPGVTILLLVTRFNWSDRDEKAKLERAAKFYAAVPEAVEFERLSTPEALAAARTLAGRLKLKISSDGLAELVDMLGADMARLANDLDKLALYAGPDREITHADLELLIPEARQSGMFEFSDALARKDGGRALEILDTLAKMGEYWPMQITLLARLFRHTLAAKESGARTVADVTRLFGRFQIPMWPARARQILDTTRQFTQHELEHALVALFHADRDLRRERPNDRLIMEQLVVELTA